MPSDNNGGFETQNQKKKDPCAKIGNRRQIEGQKIAVGSKTIQKKNRQKRPGMK